MDIKIDSEEGRFKFRVCGILKHNGKYPAVKINDNKFYCLPGGHVELDEDTDTAILREMKEELGYDVKIKKLVAINQNFFKTSTNKPFHELGFYYIVEAVNKNDINPNNYERMELDKGKWQHLEFKWFTTKELETADFMPTFIPRNLNNDQLLVNITRD